jgi:translin
MPEHESLESIAERIRSQLDATDEARERALVFGRDLTRKSASAIRLIHQGRTSEAEDMIRASAAELVRFREEIAPHPDIATAPFLTDGEKEHVEAWVTLCLAENRPWPTPEEIGCPPAAYLNGLAEGATEIRRRVIDRVRHGDTPAGEALLARMDEIYGILMTFDYPDAVLGGLKRRLDTVRGVVEKTRYDITTAIRQDRLESALGRLEERIALDESEGEGLR